MRICIAYQCFTNRKIEEYAKSLALGLEQQSNAVIELVDIAKDSDKNLTGFKYILFGSDKKNFFGSKLDNRYITFLKNCGHISGKHSFAFTSKGFNAYKFLSTFMRELEKEGVFIKNSAVLSSAVEAKIVGSKLHIK